MLLVPEQGAGRDLEGADALLDDELGFHPVAVPQGFPGIVVGADVADDENALFLDAKRGDLGETRRLDPFDDGLQRLAAAPSEKPDRHALPHADGIRG